MELESKAFFLGIFHWQSNQNYLLYLNQSNGDKDTWYFGMLGYLTYDPISESLIIPVTSHRFRSHNKWKIRHLLSGYKAIYTMKIKTYCFDTVSFSINLTQNPSVWLTLVMWEGFCGLSADRLQKIWENSWTQKKSKIDSLIFQDKCKKKTILNPATVEYQLNDSLFSSFNETSLLRWWIYGMLCRIKFAG